jgi:hypothetical protein
MVHFFHEGGGPYLKGEKPLTPSSISNTGLIDGVPPLSANGPLRFIRIIYMGQAHKSNNPPPDLKYPFIDFACFSLLFDIPVF